MKNTLLLLSLAAFAAYAKTPELLGFRIGDRLDVTDKAALAERNLTPPATVTVSRNGFQYYQCDSLAPRGGYDTYIVDVTTNGTIASVWAVIKCNDKDEVVLKVKSLAAEFNKTYADSIGNTEGTSTIEVWGGDNYVQIKAYDMEFQEMARLQDYEKVEQKPYVHPILKGEE